MKTKLAAIFAVVILALAAAGTAYAAWTSSVWINGSATLGTLDLKWYSASVKNETTPAAGISWSWSDSDHTVSITFAKVYPGYKAFIWLDTINAGNLPLRYDSFQLVASNNDYLDDVFYLGFVRPDIDAFNVQGRFEDYKPLHTYDGWGVPRASVTSQPGEVHANQIGIWVDQNVNQAYMGATLTVTFQLTATTAIT